MSGKFSELDNLELRITPLGAAVVEAMPDREQMRAIELAFKREGICPTSKIFPTAAAVETFYRAEGREIRGKQQ